MQVLTAQLPFVDIFDVAVGSFGNGLGNGLTAYYKLDEVSGQALDSGPSGLHIPNVGSPSSTAGIILNSRWIVTGGQSGFVRTNNAAFETSATGFTIGFWVKFTTALTVGQNYVLIGKGNGATAQWSWAMSIQNSGGGTYYFQFPVTYDGNNTPGFYLQTPADSFTLNTWYCVMGRINNVGTTKQTWLDIRKVGNNWSQDDVTQSNIYTANSPISIGGWSSSPTTIDPGMPAPSGTILDELAFWNRALTDCERDQFFNLGAGKAFSTYDILPCQ